MLWDNRFGGVNIADISVTIAISNLLPDSSSIFKAL